MPRKSKPQHLRALDRVTELSTRLELLGKAGLSLGKRAALLAKSVELLEELLGNPNVDPFARIAAAKTVIRDIAGVAPSKSGSSGVHAVQVPVQIVMPAWTSRPPRPTATARVLEVPAPAPQVPDEPAL